MGLCSDLGYRVPTPNRLQRAMWKVSSSRPGAWLFRRVLHHIDRVVLRLTRGRTTVPQVLAGIPVITVTTTGARTGRPRPVPLLGIPFDDDLAVIGTSFGQRHTPSWVFNLAAHPTAEVAFGGRRISAKVRELHGEEWQAAWEAGRRIYSGYEAYARRITGRTVRIFVLSAA